MQRSENGRSTRDSHHHGLPVVFATARGGGGGTAVLSGMHSPAFPLTPGCFDSFAAFRLSARFFSVLAIILSLKEHVSRPNSIPFYNHSHPHRIARSRLERVCGRRRRLAK